jgi:hypothetical protein
MEDRTALENYVRAEVSSSIDRKMAADEIIRAYVENIAREVVTEVIDARLKPFYRILAFPSPVLRPNIS